MVESVHSGYKEAAQNALTTELNSLADDGYSSLSSEIDNSTAKHLFADWELFLADPTATFDGGAVELFLIPSIDDTNFARFTEDERAQYFVGAFMTPTEDPGASGIYIALRNVALPPGKFKVAVRNTAGVAFASSGNTLKYRRWNYASA